MCVCSTDDLARRMIAMEEEAYIEFAAAFGPRLWRYLLGLGVPSGVAEDLAASCVTDIALKVEKYYEPYGGRSFDAWVFTLARHALADWKRRDRPCIPLSEHLAVPAPDLEAESEEQHSRLQVLLEKTLAELSEDDQVIIRLRDLGEERSYAEIADLLNVRPGAARVRHLRALKRLEARLRRDPWVQELLASGALGE